MARRAVEIGAAVATHQAAGGQVVFSTMTMRHHRGQALQHLFAARSAAWARVTSGSPWLRAKARHGVVGWLCAVEVTIGRNGFHVHLHALLFLAGSKATDTTVADLGQSMWRRWSAGLVAAGLDAPLPIGSYARLVTGPADRDLSAYLTKATSPATALGLELTASQSKRARSDHSTETTWVLLDRVLVDGDADALEYWHEWETASKGRRQLTWSQGLRDRLGLLDERSDEDVADEEVGSADDDLVLIDADGWSQMVRRPHLIPLLLDRAQAAGLVGVRAFLDHHLITYTLPTRDGIAHG